MVEELIPYIPKQVLSKSGSVFYSGRNAFASHRPLYLLGLNPGGSPDKQASETVASNTEKLLKDKPSNWSAYSDDSWLGKPPGSHGLQPRVLHVLASLGLDPHLTPASNLIFERTARAHELGSEFQQLAELCWPFHSQVIQRLKIKTILCFGKDAGNWVKNKVNANALIGQFQEANQRKWVSEAYKNQSGLSVVIATHPSIANWRNPLTDPTPLIKKALT